MTTSTKALFFVLTADFAVNYISTSPVSDDSVEIVVRQDILSGLGVTQLVAVAKSMNPELKVNTKQGRDIVMAAIEAELVNFPVREEAPKAKRASNKVSTKTICWDAFATIDMNDKVIAREMVAKLVEENEFPKHVVQSYASDYRKAQRTA